MAFAILGSVYGLITGIPWAIYSTFVIEERHGFNKQVMKISNNSISKKYKEIKTPNIKFLLVFFR
jgi:STE24 endopeptidase